MNKLPGICFPGNIRSIQGYPQTAGSYRLFINNRAVISMIFSPVSLFRHYTFFHLDQPVNYGVYRGTGQTLPGKWCIS